MPEPAAFVPALRFHALTRWFDAVMAHMLREESLRRDVLHAIAPRAGQAILYVGCGTGTCAIRIRRAEPAARVLAFDLDTGALEIASRKLRAVEGGIGIARASATRIPLAGGSVDCATSALVFHHLDTREKRAALTEIRRVLKPGGRFVLADWGLAADRVQRFLYYSVQILDGLRTTTENIRGSLPRLLLDAGSAAEKETARTRTMFGTLRILHGEVPPAR